MILGLLREELFRNKEKHLKLTSQSKPSQQWLLLLKNNNQRRML